MSFQRYWAVRHRVCIIVREGVEIGPYPVDSQQSDALCKAVTRAVPFCGDALAVLEDVLKVRGVELAEGANGQWGYSGILVRSHINEIEVG